MPFWRHLKPHFWDHRDSASGLHKYMFNFRRIWYLSVLLTTGVAVIPVFFLAAIDYQVTQKAIESEIMLRTSRLVSNTRRTLSFMILERQYALQYLVRDNAFEMLRDQERLDQILSSLQGSFGGFTDLGLIDRHGTQVAFSGPFELTNFNYSDQNWFQEALKQGTYISDVFLGYRQSPHLVIAVRHLSPNGDPFILRAAIEAEQFQGELLQIESGSGGDMFIVNQTGVLEDIPGLRVNPNEAGIDLHDPQPHPRGLGRQIQPGFAFTQFLIAALAEECIGEYLCYQMKSFYDLVRPGAFTFHAMETQNADERPFPCRKRDDH